VSRGPVKGRYTSARCGGGSWPELKLVARDVRRAGSAFVAGLLSCRTVLIAGGVRQDDSVSALATACWLLLLQ
jgi:hypothetical protein